MTDKLNTQVIVPVWVITLLSTLFMTVMIFSISQVKAQQNINTKVDILEKAVDKKANQSEVNRIYVVLDKIDGKVDKLLSDHS